MHVTLGGSAWESSDFPSKEEEDAYVLPVKRPVRRAEGVGDEVAVRLEVRG